MILGHRQAAPEIVPSRSVRRYTDRMLIAVLACIAGIVVENWYFPQDRSALLGRFLDSGRPAERLSLLVGLVLGHSVVRWLIAFAAAAMLVLVVLQIPGLQSAVKRAIDGGSISLAAFDAILGLAISAVMALLALVARRLAA